MFYFIAFFAILIVLIIYLYFMLYIIKANGERELFNPNKIYQSLRRSGASKGVADNIVERVQLSIRNNESTSTIYKKAFDLLKKNNESIALARYSLKKAIRELGPTGYPFEYFVSKLFEAQAYNVQVSKVFSGLCVDHEIDVVANKGVEEVLVEVKFRSRPGDGVGVKVPLYMRSRFEDILLKRDKSQVSNTRCMIFTNARFSRDAIKYAACSKSMELVGWRYPARRGLEKLVEQSGLHPITVLNTLSQEEKRTLFKNGIVVCQDINKNPDKLKELALPKNKISKIIEQSRSLCSL